jgi:hypothetical protein
VTNGEGVEAEDEIIGHRWDTAETDVLKLSTRFGKRQPNYYVCLDAGNCSWWMAPDHAERLGAALQRLAADCRRLQVEHDERQNRS